MKKQILKGLGLVAFAAVVTLNVGSFTSKKSSSASLLSLGKQAQAQCESTSTFPGGAIWIYNRGSACRWSCSPGGSNYCPI